MLLEIGLSFNLVMIEFFCFFKLEFVGFGLIGFLLFLCDWLDGLLIDLFELKLMSFMFFWLFMSMLFFFIFSIYIFLVILLFFLVSI